MRNGLQGSEWDLAILIIASLKKEKEDGWAYKLFYSLIEGKSLTCEEITYEVGEGIIMRQVKVLSG